MKPKIEYLRNGFQICVMGPLRKLVEVQAVAQFEYKGYQISMSTTHSRSAQDVRVFEPVQGETGHPYERTVADFDTVEDAIKHIDELCLPNPNTKGT